MKAAIYSRKSVFTGKGESIENQIELCREYMSKNYSDQKIEFLTYEDEGFSGGNINRPNFKKLLVDAKFKKFDALVCYRLDRISRNVADFSNTLELLQKNNISFISIREQFDTSTPMGKAMVYISSVFAQLERDTIAERVRDNMLQLSKTGRWLGGQEPYGFISKKVTYLDSELKERSLMILSPVCKELETVKLIFAKYRELQSAAQVAKYLNFAKIKGKNGGTWASTQLKRILKNPLYVKSSKRTDKYLKSLGINVFGTPDGSGYLTYNKTKSIRFDRDISEWIASTGKHKGIISDTDWLEVQKSIQKNKNTNPRLGTGKSDALLTGILKCAKCKSNMIIKHGHNSRTKNHIRYDYYVCSKKDSSYGHLCNNKNIRVDKLDKLVIDKINAYDRNKLIKKLETSLKYFKSPNLNKYIESRKKAINNLVKKLSKTNDEQITGEILNEIKKMNEEINNLKNESLSDNKKVNITPDSNMNINCIKNIRIKRIILKTVIDEIFWDGENQKFEIILSGTEKNSP